MLGLDQLGLDFVNLNRNASRTELDKTQIQVMYKHRDFFVRSLKESIGTYAQQYSQELKSVNYLEIQEQEISEAIDFALAQIKEQKQKYEFTHLQLRAILHIYSMSSMASQLAVQKINSYPVYSTYPFGYSSSLTYPSNYDFSSSTSPTSEFTSTPTPD